MVHVTWLVKSIPTNLNNDIRFKFLCFIVFYPSCIVFEILYKHLFVIFFPIVPLGDRCKFAFILCVIKDCRSVLCNRQPLCDFELNYIIKQW